MTRLTNEHRAAIVKGMMRKTNFKKRFEIEIKRLGSVARGPHHEWMVATYGKPLVDYIARMNKEHRRVLCSEVEQVPFSWRSSDLYGVAPNLLELAGYGRGRSGYEDSAFYVGDLFRGSLVYVRLPRPVHVPRHGQELYLKDVQGIDQALAPMDGLATEFNHAIEQIGQFLRTVTTVPRLKDLMPEAAEFLPELSHPLAVIPDASSAMAVLTRAGFYENAEVAHA